MSSTTNVTSLPLDQLNQFIQQRCAHLNTIIPNAEQTLQNKLPHVYTSHAFAIPAPAAVSIGSYIDHTALKPETSSKQIDQLTQEAVTHHFFSVCVNGSRVAQAAANFAALPADSYRPAIAAVCGFPLGAHGAHVKALECEQLVKDGATEVDMVIDVGRMIDGDYAYVFHDIQGVVQAAARINNKVLVKVIFETCLLTETQIVDACLLSTLAGAHFVKTSTGFSTAGATVPHISLMRRVVGNTLQVKASGGIRDYATARSMIEAGATRLGVSAGIAIVKGEAGGHVEKATGSGNY